MVEEDEFIFYAIHVDKIFLNSVEMVGKIISRLLSCFTAFIKPSESQHLQKEIDVSKSYKKLKN